MITRIAKHLDEVLKASQRAKEIIQQILTFTRQQKDQRELILLQPIVAECGKTGPHYAAR